MQSKINFVQELSNVLTFKDNIPNVESVEYQIFVSTTSPDRKQEFIRVNYVGGAYSVRNSNGNSLSAIFRVVGALLDHGYYDEIEWYENDYLNNPDWVLQTA